ncbi:MAG: NifU family protein [Planctomycetota bacterium]
MPVAKPTLTERVAEVLERIRPAVQDDGGDVELVDVTNAGTVRVRFHGACIGCPSAGLTLRHGIERVLKDKLPEVKKVEPVE